MAIVYNTTIDQGADWFINYVYNQPALITNITSNGTTVTVTANNGFVEGQTISISGVLPSQFNLNNMIVTGSTTEYFTFDAPVQGVYISGGVAYAPVYLLNNSAALQLRSLPGDPDAVLTLTTDNGGIEITSLTGVIAVHATADQTRAIDAGYYYYDLEITDNNTQVVTRVAQGQILVSAEITNA